jgi:hypothetical protein
MGEFIAIFAIFCALIGLPVVVMGGSMAGKWLDLQRDRLELEREKVRLLRRRLELEDDARLEDDEIHHYLNEA